MNELKERIKRLDIDPFNYRVYIVITSSVQLSAAKRGVPVGDVVGAFHMTPDNGALTSQIVLPLDADPAVVAHEAFHCVWHIMQAIGAQMENEVMAYTLTYLITEILRFMNMEFRIVTTKTKKKSK